MFYDEYARLCEKKGVTPSRAALECGISKSTVSCWKSRGNIPNSSVIDTLCKYFDCEIADFFPTKKEPTSELEVDSEIERIFNSLSPAKQEQALEFLRFLQGNSSK